MEKIELKYRQLDKATAPRPIRLDVGGWAGESQRPQDGAETQPWHCLPFVEGSTYGLELVYDREVGCQVVNDGGTIRFERDGKIDESRDEFTTFARGHYGFNTELDIQAPAGSVLRLEPHPRFFTDTTGTIPIAVIGHLQTEWWPRYFFVAFKAPGRGERHIFRKGEAYAQLIVVPQRVTYAIEEMSEDEKRRRLAVHLPLLTIGQQICKHSWKDVRGVEFNDKYKVLARAFAGEGEEGIRKVVNKAIESVAPAVPADATTAQVIEAALQHYQAGRLGEAMGLALKVVANESSNGDALNLLGVLAGRAGEYVPAIELMGRAVATNPQSAMFQNNYGEALQVERRFEEAAAAFEAALAAAPNAAPVLSNLGAVRIEQGRAAEAVVLLQRAVEIAPGDAVAQDRLGNAMARDGRHEEAPPAQPFSRKS